MRVGMVCYASVGGSGVVGTELARALARRGHHVHLISSEPPFRWREGESRLSFERVETPAYPLFREPQYLLSLANTIVRVACEQQLDVIHAHYAVPHATAAYLADRVLVAGNVSPIPRTVTTLHGTDITLVGADPSYQRVVAFSIDQSDAVTAVSLSLAQQTVEALGVRSRIHVIPNFLDVEEFSFRPDSGIRQRVAGAGTAVLMHISNFRPVKRTDRVYEVFRGVARQLDVSLVLVGDGPERASLERRAAADNVASRVLFAGEQHDLAAWLSAADVFLLPSDQESFGLAALEAMSCGVPVVASGVGGLPEVIEDGETGFLCRPDDVPAMIARTVELLENRGLASRIGARAAASVRSRFAADRIVPEYEALYTSVLGSAPSVAASS